MQISSIVHMFQWYGMGSNPMKQLKMSWGGEKGQHTSIANRTTLKIKGQFWIFHSSREGANNWCIVQLCFIMQHPKKNVLSNSIVQFYCIKCKLITAEMCKSSPFGQWTEDTNRRWMSYQEIAYVSLLDSTSSCGLRFT